MNAVKQSPLFRTSLSGTLPAADFLVRMMAQLRHTGTRKSPAACFRTWKSERALSVVGPKERSE